MVVLLTMIPIVGFSMFLEPMLSLLPIGALVLLYTTSYYPIRGGHSNDNLFCGIFFDNLYMISTSSYWNGGAALS